MSGHVYVNVRTLRCIASFTASAADVSCGRSFFAGAALVADGAPGCGGGGGGGAPPPAPGGNSGGGEGSGVRGDDTSVEEEVDEATEALAAAVLEAKRAQFAGTGDSAAAAKVNAAAKVSADAEVGSRN